MDCKTANNINPIHVLKHHYCLQCDKETNKGFWFKIGDQRTGSLKVDPIKKRWYDFSNGKGGKTIDLVCYLSNVSVSGALMILQGFTPPSLDSFSFDKQIHKQEFKLNHVQPLQNKALIQYLNGRNIPFYITKQIPHLKEAYWNYNGKNQFALAWENDQGGFELRSKFFKGATSPKTITTIPGITKGVNIFEGFMDYLSAGVFFKQPSQNTTIVLNSLSFIDKIIPELKKYNSINLFLDNDESGKKAAGRITKHHHNTTNRAEQYYRSYKDFNELLFTYKNKNHEFKIKENAFE